MNIISIIEKKRDGFELSNEEIEFFVEGYTKGDIADYQASALLMAVYINKMTEKETYALANSMKNSGDIVDLSSIAGVKVDKHSTGGVGDKTTLIVGPLAAANGVPIAKMSGRGLGFTGGTVDKMESIPNMKTSLEEDEFFDLVNNVGLAVIGQTAHIAPADKKIYALRDVTATVGNLSLISSSIMSKKLASGSDAILLDVKCGSGAFMETIEDAEKLGKIMVSIGKADNKKVVAAITDMNQPLGRNVGNSLEVIEAIETLKGNGPEDITALSIELAGIMIYLGEKAESVEAGRQKAKETLYNGEGLEKFKEFVKGQGGNPDVVDNYELFPIPTKEVNFIAEEDGYVERIIADKVGYASQKSGAGRQKKEDPLDLSAGIVLNSKVGDYVKKGDIIATIYGNDLNKLEDSLEELKNAYFFNNEMPIKEPLIKKIIWE